MKMMLTVNLGPFLPELRIVGCYDNNFSNKYNLQKISFRGEEKFYFHPKCLEKPTHIL